jgi:predicted ATPase
VRPAADRVLFFDFHTANDHFKDRFARETYKNLEGWETRIAQALARVFPGLEGVRVNTKPVDDGTGWTGYLEWPGRKPIEIDQFGDGTRHAFKVLAGLIALCETVDDEHPGLFLWEDPELFMHPATLGRLLDFFAR